MAHTAKRVSLALPPSNDAWICDFLFLLSPPAPKPDVTFKLNPKYTSSKYNVDTLTGIENCEQSISQDIQSIFDAYWEDGNENRIIMFWSIGFAVWLIIGAILTFAALPGNNIMLTIWIVGIILIGSVICGMFLCADAGNNNKKRYVKILKKVESKLESHWRYKYNESECVFTFDNDIYVEYLDLKDKINHQPESDIRRKYGLIRLKHKKSGSISVNSSLQLTNKTSTSIGSPRSVVSVNSVSATNSNFISGIGNNNNTNNNNININSENKAKYDTTAVATINENESTNVNTTPSTNNGNNTNLNQLQLVVTVPEESKDDKGGDSDRDQGLNYMTMSSNSNVVGLNNGSDNEMKINSNNNNNINNNNSSTTTTTTNINDISTGDKVWEQMDYVERRKSTYVDAHRNESQIPQLVAGVASVSSTQNRRNDNNDNDEKKTEDSESDSMLGRNYR